MITVSCIECNTKFEAQRTSAKFCSANCRVKYNNRPEHQLSEEPAKEPPKTKMVVTPKGLQMKPSNEQIAKMRLVMDKLNKDYGEGTVMMFGDKPKDGYEVISTGSYGIDDAVGIGGLPLGRIVELYGPNASGKTTIAINIIKNAQDKKLRCLMIDPETTFDMEYAQSLGVDIDSLLYCQPSYGEQALEVADRYISSGQIDVVIIDSVAALVPKAELEGEHGETKMGLHARLMSQACRKLTGVTAKNNVLLLFLNQIRKTMGSPYEPTEVVPGGMALGFYSSIRLEVRRSTQIKDGEVSIGNKVRCKVVKNKCAPPFKACEFDIIFGKGINQLGEIVDMAVQKNVIQKAGSWFSYGDMKLGQGRDSVVSILNDHPDMLTEIKNKLQK